MAKDEKRPSPPKPGSRHETLVELYGRMGQPVYNFFANRGCCKEEARDLRQETFLRAFNGLESFRGDAQLETWVFGIAKMVWLHRLRDRGRQKRQGFEVSIEAEGDARGSASVETSLVAKESPFEAAVRAEQVRLIRDGLTKLPAIMRQCTLLRIEQQMQYSEIARVLQITVSQVKTNLSRARSRLKDQFRDHRMEVGLPESAT